MFKSLSCESLGYLERCSFRSTNDNRQQLDGCSQQWRQIDCGPSSSSQLQMIVHSRSLIDLNCNFLLPHAPPPPPPPLPAISASTKQSHCQSSHRDISHFTASSKSVVRQRLVLHNSVTEYDPNTSPVFDTILAWRFCFSISDFRFLLVTNSQTVALKWSPPIQQTQLDHLRTMITII